MAQEGEAQGGYGLFFGGIARREVVKSMFFPVTYAAGGSAIGKMGDHVGALIDGVGETCGIEAQVPTGYTTLYRAYLLAIDVAGGIAANMNLTLDYDIAEVGEAYNLVSGTLALMDTVGLNRIEDFGFLQMWTAFDALPLVQGEMIGLTCTYAGAGGGGNATNLFILGFLLRWA